MPIASDDCDGIATNAPTVGETSSNVTLSVPSRFLSLAAMINMRCGEPSPSAQVNVTSDQKRFTAAVSRIVPAGDPRTQSFEVLVKAPPVDGLLAPGNSVEVELPLGAPQRKLAVHRDALIIRAEGLYVYRVNGDQRAERVPVKAGVADGSWLAVDGALKSGDQVIVRGAELLRGNELVQVVGILEDAPSQVAVK